MKKSRSMLAGMLALTMVGMNSVSVSAADIVSYETGKNSQGLTGAGTLEGYVETNVIKVVLPTTSLNFSVDPQGLMPKSDARKLTNLTADATVTWRQGGSALSDNDAKKAASGCVFFSTTTPDDTDSKKVKAVEYSDEIALDVYNKSSCKVYIVPSIKIVNPSTTGVTVVEDVLSSETTPAISMKLTYGADKTVYAKSVEKATDVGNSGVAISVDGIPDSYAYKYASGKYTYTLDETGATVTGTKSSFKVLGDCNTDAEWSKKTAFKPSLNVTWTITTEDPTPTPGD